MGLFLYLSHHVSLGVIMSKTCQIKQKVGENIKGNGNIGRLSIERVFKPFATYDPLQILNTPFLSSPPCKKYSILPCFPQNCRNLFTPPLARGKVEPMVYVYVYMYKILVQMKARCQNIFKRLFHFEYLIEKTIYIIYNKDSGYIY